MKPNGPKLTRTDKSTRPELINNRTDIKRKSQISFSFQYFNQIKYFGLDRVTIAWVVGLITRLKDWSSKTTKITNPIEAQAYRFHKIDWNHRNIPITLDDLNWIPQEYRDNADDFPLHQFEISQANGRVIGFFNEESTVFHIVLLDPCHNMQPCKYSKYKLRECGIQHSLYEELLGKMDFIRDIAMKCQYDECRIKKEIEYDGHIVSFCIDESYEKELKKALETTSMKEIIERGILGLQE